MQELVEGGRLFLYGGDGIIGQILHGNGSLLKALEGRAVFRRKQLSKAFPLPGIQFLERGAGFFVVAFNGGEGVVGNP